MLRRLVKRLELREKASLEAPHILVFFDDPEHRIDAELKSLQAEMREEYSFELMQGGGWIRGSSLRNAAAERLVNRYSRASYDDHVDPASAKVKLLHLLLQQFIDPYSSIRQIEGVKQGGEPCSYRIPCNAKPETGKSSFKDLFAAGTYPVIRRRRKKKRRNGSNQ